MKEIIVLRVLCIHKVVEGLDVWKDVPNLGPLIAWGYWHICNHGDQQLCVCLCLCVFRHTHTHI